MKYMLLMQFSEKTVDFPGIGRWTPEELQAHIRFMKDTNRELAEAGELVDAQGLAMPETARIVRSHEGGAPVITEGPFPETKEFLAGWWIVDCDGDERAVEIAAQVSAAPGPGGRPLNMPIEVRQVMSAPPTEL
ncbi:YciI family protein [Streptomyces sp. NBC_00539]|uniref:YciI family protein n=1 Tax=Streptomyces sp. NBC_00539 TaxID=2975770 RepID=UPI002E8201D5|nr:YciI family protein [Streptomyces sp. NBC_00539]WUC63170.1 YciI family protein [Streptomyces sp. NBC_00539]